MSGVSGKTKRELIFEELNQMIAYTKRLEFEIRRCIDTPLKNFKILLTRHNSIPGNRYQPSNYQSIKDHYFHEDVKLDDVAKIMKFASAFIGPLTFNSHGQLTGGGSSIYNVESQVMQNLNVPEFIHSLQHFEQ